MKLAENLYVYEWTNYFENNCNSYFIGGAVGALVDPGLSAHLPDLLRRMSRDGIGKEDIKIVVNTHSHPDHYEASALFDGSRVKIALSEIEMDFMKGPGAYLYGLFGLKAPDVDVNLPLKEGELQLGAETFQVSIVPGHSPGSIGLYWPAKKVLFSGDVIFQMNVGRSDFPGGDSKLLRESILSLSRLDVEYLLPGHMGMVTGRSNVKKNFDRVIEEIFPYL
ncbi:MAG: MBL fold metallo-hydrolase [Pseudomonadota bacterium]|nr:MBL fold metallo-hydrolase [Syntrophaceae bacterium]MBP7032794.1 MBL fold metallo-hydrolase [Syntrophobacterales bacterium]MDI9554724.1 MBL fold metallo-hydrolase [Pseudomonadota bacterium]NLX30687.1 MBL fold metallo-hydrolase [Deltaproteobacteria bacterium]HNU84604.1 MBL fold metallo-hydrolase [Syntrophales bacterium]